MVKGRKFKQTDIHFLTAALPPPFLFSAHQSIFMSLTFLPLLSFLLLMSPFLKPSFH